MSPRETPASGRPGGAAGSRKVTPVSSTSARRSAAADRLAEVLDTGVTFRDPAAPPGRPEAGVSLGDMTLALYPIPEAGLSERLWGHVYQRAQTSNLGVRVPDLG